MARICVLLANMPQPGLFTFDTLMVCNDDTPLESDAGYKSIWFIVDVFMCGTSELSFLTTPLYRPATVLDSAWVAIDPEDRKVLVNDRKWKFNRKIIEKEYASGLSNGIITITNIDLHTILIDKSKPENG